MPRPTIYEFGERAGQLPGPEILAVIDPLDLLPGATAAILVPASTDHPDAIVRWYPHKPLRWGGVVSKDENANGALITEAMRHFGILEVVSGGVLCVPHHRSFTAAHPLNPELPAIITIAERANGDQMEAEGSDPRSAASLFGSLAYFNHIMGDEDEEHILSDIFRPDQSLLGVASSPNTMVDTDAMLMPRGYMNEDFYGRRFTKWRRQLEPNTTFDTLIHTALQEAGKYLDD